MPEKGADYIDNAMSRHQNTPGRFTPTEDRDIVDAIGLLPNGNHSGNDENDNFPELHGEEGNDWPPKFTMIDFILGLAGMFLFLFDLVSDWRLAISYYFEDRLWLFYLSAGFIIVPSLFSGIVSIIWYTMEQRDREQTSKIRFCLRIVMSFLQLGRVFRSFESVWFMVKSWKAHPSRQNHLREKTIHQMQDAVILELLDGFLESAIQLILQLYLSVYVPIKIDIVRGGTLLLSLGSTAVTHMSYYRVNRLSKKDKGNAGYIGSALYLLWRICELGPRFLLLSLSIYCFYPFCFIPIFMHFVFVFGLFCYLDPELSGICHNRCCNYPFLVLMSYIGTFCFVNLKEGTTKRVATLYYVIFYIENVAMTVLIIWYSVSRGTFLGAWTYSTLSIVPGGLLQFTFMFVFYKFFHPNRRNITCTILSE